MKFRAIVAKVMAAVTAVRTLHAFHDPVVVVVG